jgi:peptidylprolyl isomerase
MNVHLKKLYIFSFTLFLYSCNSPGVNNQTIISIKTTLGEIKIKLYDETPKHRDNFIKLIKSGVYDNVSFHRVIKDFMIQSGDPLTRLSSGPIPDSLTKYTVPAEINPKFFHKKGALAAARKGNDENPEMRSSGTQFYIVQGIKYSDEELNQAQILINSNIKQSIFRKLIKETSDSLLISKTTSTDAEIQEIASLKMFDFLTTQKSYKIPEDQRTIYKTIGGTPRLDGTYTVFGEVTEGLDIIDRIASVKTDSNDKPLTDIKIIRIRIISN